MARFYTLFFLCLTILFELSTSIKYSCTTTKKNGIDCQCDVIGPSKAKAKISCKSDAEFCDSKATNLGKDKVFIAFCTEEKVGLVHKTDENKYAYSEINNLACSTKKDNNVCKGSIDTEKKDSLNVYKRWLQKISNFFH